MEEYYRQIYESVREGLSTYSYDEVMIKCEEIGQGTYALQDNLTNTFLGIVDMNESNYSEFGMDFESFLVADCWDIRQVRALIGEHYPRCVYMIPNDMRLFSGFLQIPGFVEKYLNNYIVFDSVDVMKLFFTTYKQFYLPKKTIAVDLAYYENIVEELHQIRLADAEERERNIFLSICIPTYNRGEEALRAVEQLQMLPYDEEIEIIVSNNFSDKTEEFYKRIEGLQDSRIRYIRTSEQLGYAGNVMNVMRLARGQYVLIQSDEDLLINENLPEYLDMMVKYQGISVICGSGEGENMPHEPLDCYSDNRVDCICAALDRYYLTGMLYKKSCLEMSDFEICKKLLKEENYYTLLYIHCLLLARVAQRGDVYARTLPLYLAGDESQTEYYKACDHLNAEGRLKQFESEFEMLNEAFDLTVEQYAEIIGRRIDRLYDLVVVGLKSFYKYYIEKGESKEGILKKVYTEAQTIIREQAADKDVEVLVMWLNYNEKYFKESLVRVAEI